MAFSTMIKPHNYNTKMQQDTKRQNINFMCLLIWIFLISCTLGFVVEVTYTYFTKGHYVNKQGMLYGPFKPIYGFGGVLFTILFYKVRHYRTYVLFILGSVTGAIYEYFCSYLQEILFKSRSWNYSKFKYNINGRINPTHAIYWGILAMIFIKLILPIIIIIASKIPIKIQKPIAIVVAVFMTINMFLSACAVMRQVERIKSIPPQNKFEHFLDKHYGDKTIRETFTHMKFVYVDKNEK